MKRQTSITSGLLGGSLVLAATQVNAQEQLAQTPSSDIGYPIEEIVVTATKRETPLLFTPLAITALSGDYLDEIGAGQFEDYFSKVPGLNAVDQGAGRKRYVIRGVNIIESGLAQATVAQYLDEVPITNNFDRQPDPVLVDVDRVEVLRGPQGTLFGARSMAGTVRTITRKPDFERVEGSARALVSTTKFGGENVSIDGAVNVPLVDDTLALRLVGFYQDESGYIDNDFAGGLFIATNLPPGVPPPPPLLLDPLKEDNINSVKRYGGRAALRWQPADRLTIDAMAMAQLGRINGIPFYQVQLTNDESDGLKIPIAVADGNGNKDDAITTSLTANYELDWGTFTWVSSYYKRDNFTESAEAPGGITGPDGPGSTRTRGADTDSVTLEARFASDLNGPTQWLVGGYFFDETRKGAMINFVAFARQIVDSSTFTERRDEQAVFGEVSYTPVDGLTLTAGARYSDFHSDISRFFIIPPPFLPIQPGPDPNMPMYDQGGTTLKFLVSYEASDNTFLYAQAAEGFRAGGFNPNFREGVSAFNEEFESDTLWSYELGARSTFMNGRLYVDGAFFFIDWNNIQIINFTQAPGGGPMRILFTENAGAAEISGIEFQASLQAMRGLDLDLAFNHFFKAELSEDFPATAGQVLPQQGDPLPNTSETSFNLGVQYTRPIGRDLDAFGRIDWRYTSGQTTGFRPLNANSTVNNDYNEFDDYSIVNLRAGVNLDRTRISVFANNVTDARPTINQRNFLPETFTNRVTVRPRTIGVSVDTRF